MSDALDRFAPATHEWFSQTFAAPTPAQVGAWESLDEGDHVLVVAPTGSGKTLAAFLSSIDRLLHESSNAVSSAARGPASPPGGTRVLYISPLKALAVDVERNLRSPLVGITQAAARRGEEFHQVSAGVRSGDTPQQERRRLVSQPPDILITTPESLFLMLTSSARESLRDVDTVIVDEIHAVAGTKRGAHLAVSLERLDGLLARPARRVGLSATVRPHDEVARFLGGRAPVRIVAPESESLLSLDVTVPVDDMTKLAQGTDGESSPSIWPHIEHDLLDRMLQVRSTIVFCNSRGLAERLTARLNEAWAERENVAATESIRPPAQLMGGSAQGKGAEPVLARAHHGSVSKEQRELIENDLKSGRLRCVVATSSLELGIDMGAVDLVVQISTPPSVASGLQRVGRAGHQVGEISRGIVYPTTRHDLVGAAVTAERMRDGLIEQLVVPANPLDVLAQHTVAACALEPVGVEHWFDVVRRSAPFSTLPRSAFDATLDLLAGRYPSDEFAELRPRLVWDRDAGTLTGRPGAQRLAVTSGGTIPDRGLFAVTLAEGSDEGTGGRRVGELDEEMVYESRINDVFALGATSWRIQEITHDRVVVTPAFGEPARLPFWKGDTVGRPYELGAAIGDYVRRHLEGETPADLDARSASNLAAFLLEQREAAGIVPTDRTLVVERFRDELGDWRVVLLSPYGRRVHAPWALAVGARIIERFGIDGSVVASDDGIVARLPDTGVEAPGAELFVFDPDELEDIVTVEVGGSALFASRFRECAARALLLPRRNPGARAPLWQQRQRSAQLLEVARKYPDFPILLETARECLQDVYDLPALAALTRRIASREIQLAEVTTERASPFAQTLLFGYVASFLYEGDTPLAERRAAALTLDPTLLAELLGRAELRELLDPEVIERTESELQRLADDRRVSGIEGAADLLRLLGPLTAGEVMHRLTEGEAAPLLEELRDSRRAIEVTIAGEVRWAAVEDAGRLRDALGSALPLGVAEAHLKGVDDPLADLLSRHARTHGPFTTSEAAARFGLGAAVAADVLRRLSRDGRLTEGEFRPQATGSEWVEPGVLRRLRSRSLAAARKQVEPVDAAAFARFLPSWQGVGPGGGAGPRAALAGTGARGVEAVLGVVDQLAGLSLPASAWESLVLPCRVADYSPAMLDELLGAGEIVWTGAGTLPGRDGWVQLHPADLVLPVLRDVPEPDTLGQAILGALDGGGAFLFRQLTSVLDEPADDTPGGGAGQRAADDMVADALWQLVWSGRVAGDTFAPVRALLGGRGARRPSSRSPRARLRTGRGRASSMRAAQQGPPTVTGRWFRLDQTEPGGGAGPRAAKTSTDPTKLQLARTEALLARYGVVTRGSVVAEQTPGGFAATYRVLRELEQTGACLRGYYIDTLGAAQFASPATVDRLRSHQRNDDDVAADDSALVLAATDPANPFGAALPWPDVVDADESSRHRPARRAGSLAVVHDGHAVLYLERGGRRVLVLHDDPRRLAPAADALAALVRTGRVPRLTVETAGGRSIGSTALGEALRGAGFVPHPKGLRLDARR